MTDPPATERIGLLFVHGIGAQQRFEFLRAGVVAFAELMKQSGDPGERLGASVVDRTADWTSAPGQPHPHGLSPVTLTMESPQRRLVFECQEVWWADLGARTGLAGTIAFWFWGIGQWLAPIYRDMDAADLAKVTRSADGERYTKPASRLVKLPESVSGRFGPECVARVRLATAALATLFAVVGWVVLKRLFAALLGKTPSPTLLASYVGEVRTYEQRAAPGRAAPSDPGQPRRVGIRRRMVAEMVRMGARDDLDRWYVVAHSQGSVLAYNGLTEIGHTLPNYLDEAAWRALPAHLKRDGDCLLRPADEIAEMMPARPPWLRAHDVINRPALFGKLRGLLTYGSPLNKFAAIWPRIVATATDRAPHAAPPFGDGCRWVNAHALQDPVAGDVTRYFGPVANKPGFNVAIPPINDIQTPFRPNVLIAHHRYFDVAERFAHRLAVTQRHALMRWLMTRDAAAANAAVERVEQPRGRARQAASELFYLGVLAVLALFAIATVTLGGDLIAALFGKVDLVWIGVPAFVRRAVGNVVPVLAAAMTLLAAAGHGRWIRESWLNVRIAGENRAVPVAGLLRAQLVAATVTPVAVIGVALAVGAAGPNGWRLAPLTFLLRQSGALVVAGVVIQAFVNRVAGTPLRYER